MKRYKLLALAVVVAMGLTACTPQEVEPVNAPEPSSSSEPIVSSEPKETPSEAVPSDVPVSSDVEETADIEGESNLDESGEVITEVEGKTPGGMVDQNTDNSTGGSTSGNTGSSKPTTPSTPKPDTSKPSGGNDNSSTQSKPTPPASNNGKDWSEADDEVGGSIDDLINAGKDQDGIDDGAWDEGFDPVNNGDFGGNISEEDILNWGSDNTDGGETGGGTFTDDELDNWGSDNGATDEENKEFTDNVQKGFDPVQ